MCPWYPAIDYLIQITLIWGVVPQNLSLLDSSNVSTVDKEPPILLKHNSHHIPTSHLRPGYQAQFLFFFMY